MGCDVVRNPVDVRRRIAVVLQQTAVDSLLTVQDNLLIYAYLHHVPRHEAWKRMQAVVEEFELGDKLGQTVYDLSIGTKRRVQVADLYGFAGDLYGRGDDRHGPVHETARHGSHNR